MNEIVKAAAKEAGFYIAPQHNVNTMMLEKFATLLLDEAIEHAKDEIQYHTNWDIADEVAASLKKHFGA